MEVKGVMVPHGQRGKIQKALNVCHVTVRRALKGEINTETARRIRYVAVKEYGGVEYSLSVGSQKIEY